MPSAAPSDALINVYLGKTPKRGSGAEPAPPPAPQLTWEEFAEAYRAEMRTPSGIEALDNLIAIAQADPSRPLAVLCWERLDKPGMHCHRTVLVELLEERARERGLPVAREEP